MRGRVYKAARFPVLDAGGKPVKSKDGREKFRWKEVSDIKPGVFFIDYRDVSGRRVRKQVTATSRTLAGKLLTEALSLNNKAEILGVDSLDAVKPMKFSAFVDEEKTGYLAIKANKKPATLRRLKLSYENCKERFGEMTLRSITAGHVEAFMSLRHQAGLSNATVNRERSFLSGVFAMAKRRKLVDENPVLLVEPYDEDNEGRDFDYEEQKLIFDNLTSWAKPIVEFALNTGMRLGEVAALEWRRVKLADGFIGLGAQDTKGKYARQVPINSKVREILEARKPEKLGPDLFVWINPAPKAKGKRFSDSGISHAFKRAVKKAGLPFKGPNKIVFHSTRHTFVSRMVRAGVSSPFIKAIVGHKSDKLIEKYTHLKNSDLRGATEMLVSSGVGNQLVTGTRGG